MDTIQTLRTQLGARKGGWRQLCTTTGLSYWWLIKFAQGRIAEPGLSKIERLQHFFDANPLTEPNAGESPAKVA